jgi:acyl-CoA thioesterase-1
MILSFADGTTFFIGLLLVLMANLLLLRYRVGAIRGVMTVLSIVGLIFVVISATPFPLWAYAIWFLATTSALVAGTVTTCSQKVRLVLSGFILIVTAALIFAELPFHRLPSLSVQKGTTVYVIGDSISAGMGTMEKCWPQVLKETTSLSVVNLAQPGATVQSALKQLEGIQETNAVVIVEIGGNDMIGGIDATLFGNQLDLILSSLRLRLLQIVMIEIPLFPFQNGLGNAQRKLAAKHGVFLIPKHYFVKVLGTENGTLDGLHLSQAGHNAMAGIIATVIQEK